MLGNDPKNHIEDNCFHNVHFGKYIVRYTVGKHDFRLYISDDIHVPPKMNILNMVIPILKHLCACLPFKSLFRLELECPKPHKMARHPTK